MLWLTEEYFSSGAINQAVYAINMHISPKKHSIIEMKFSISVPVSSFLT